MCGSAWWKVETFTRTGMDYSWETHLLFFNTFIRSAATAEELLSFNRVLERVVPRKVREVKGEKETVCFPSLINWTGLLKGFNSLPATHYNCLYASRRRKLFFMQLTSIGGSQWARRGRPRRWAAWRYAPSCPSAQWRWAPRWSLWTLRTKRFRDSEHSVNLCISISLTSSTKVLLFLFVFVC